MANSLPSRWSIPRMLLGLAAAVSVAVVALLLVDRTGPQAQGATVPRATAGFQTTERLALTVTLPGVEGSAPRGTLKVELLDAAGKVLAEAEQEAQPGADVTSHRFEFAPTRVAADKITVRCRFAGQKPVETSLAGILLAKAHETALSAGAEFFAGSQAALRCEVHGVKSLSEIIPLPGASVAVRLRDDKGKVTPLYSGKAGGDGVAAVKFEVPPVPPGSYKMEVVTSSTLGEEKLERDVKVKTAPKVLLVTDKPLYQPGQRMHLRALALGAFDLKPAAGRELVFEVEDAKGNKVFKRSLKTSDYGIAAADFDLADEVNAGDYRVRAILGEHQADKTVQVRPYVLPKFKSELKADKKYYLPKETIHADLQVDYFFGKPVAGGKVKVVASTFDVAFKEFQTWEGVTDPQGHVPFEIKLPDYFVGQPLQKGNALVRLEVKVTDTADHTEVINKTYPVSAQPIQVSLIPEGGRIVPGLENRIFAAAIYPDGSPARCEVRVWVGNAAKGRPLAEVQTNEAGLAEFRLTPKAEQFRQGGWGNRQVEMMGGQKPQVWGPQQFLDLTAAAKDDRGDTAQATVNLTSEPLGENVLLRLDKAVYKGGDAVHIDIRTSAGLPTVYLDVIKAGQTVLTQWLDVKDGKASSKLDLPPSVFGTLEIHAYQLLASGEIIRDSRVAYVNPASDLQIHVRADKEVYTPGEQGSIRFEVKDAAGNPAAAALGVLIVDEAVYALQEMQPGLEKVYFTLQEELLKPQVQAVYKPAARLDDLVREPILAEAQQQAAEVLLTAVRPSLPARWEVNPAFERRRKAEAQIQQIAWALFNYAKTKTAVIKDAKTGKWEFRPDVLQEMVKAKAIDPTLLTDPVGGQYTVEALARLEKHFTAERLAKAIASNDWVEAQAWWMSDEDRKALQGQMVWTRRRAGMMRNEGMAALGAMPGGFRGVGGGGRFPPGAPPAPMAAEAFMPLPKAAAKSDAPPPKPTEGPAGESGGPAPARLREYFPETLLWQPALITDERGVADLKVPFADSITTWRLTASASSRGGLLGGISAPLRVFQDFFVDIDLPVALTQNDEVAFPVAVYNYLKQPQTVKLDLQKEEWFELTDGQGLTRSMELKPNEVTGIKFRVRAKRVGHFPLTVKAQGTKMSDAVKRSVEVVPDGKKVEQVASDRLAGKVTQHIVIPDNAIPDASRLFVKVYPGVMSQVLEGAQGLIRLPGG